MTWINSKSKFKSYTVFDLIPKLDCTEYIFLESLQQFSYEKSMCTTMAMMWPVSTLHKEYKQCFIADLKAPILIWVKKKY